MVTTLQNAHSTYRLEFAPAGEAKVRVAELAHVDGAWHEKEAIVVSLERALSLKQFALRNDYSSLKAS